MKKASILMVAITLVFVAFTCGFLLGRNMTHGKVTISAAPSSGSTPSEPTLTNKTTTSSDGLIDLNTATIHELTQLPGIGETLAQRIVDYRETNGPFTSPGELANVSGIGEKRIQDILELITIGGTS